MSKEEFRVLTAIEIGMRNHELVPISIIERLSHLKRGCASKVVKLLLKNKFIAHENKKYDGYKLTYIGYDYLALQVFIRRGAIKEVMGKIGCGKESDIYKCVNDNGEFVILKFTRLGRTSFRTIKNNRDYIQHRTSYSWLYLSRLSAIKEFSFMDLLYKNGFPTPVPIEQNRHGIVMSLIDGVPMQNVAEIDNPKFVFDQCFDLIKRLAESPTFFFEQIKKSGLIHSDFNEFNLMIEQGAKVTMIDFPQMVSTKHKNADFYFNRDVECIHTFFERRFNYQNRDTLDLDRITRTNDLDVQVKASGFVKKEIRNIDDFDIDLRGSDHDNDSQSDEEETKQQILDFNSEEDDDAEDQNNEEEEQGPSVQAKDNKKKDEKEKPENKENKEIKEEVIEKQPEQEDPTLEDHEIEEVEGKFSPDISEISVDDIRELQRVNQDLFSEDECDHPLQEEQNDLKTNCEKDQKDQKNEKKKKKQLIVSQENPEVDNRQLKEKIFIKDSDLADKAKAFVQKQIQKQLKQKHKILKKSNKQNYKVEPAEYM